MAREMLQCPHCERSQTKGQAQEFTGRASPRDEYHTIFYQCYYCDGKWWERDGIKTWTPDKSWPENAEETYVY